ncbi:hypothetical protein C8Q80DRAFT_1101041, partial [Daedaleopsis nitida]
MVRNSNLNGFRIPGAADALITRLFADDTTVFLSEDDDFADLQSVLDTWCSAAKAKFNIAKTEILPIGKKVFREEIVRTYRSTGSWENYPENVRIVGEGEPMRILGAFIGNNVDQAGVWSPTIAKVTSAIERWRLGHATVEGRRHAIQMVVGGMTQFLTDVQRMPSAVCKRLDKCIRQYLWDGRVLPPVAKDYIYTPREDGGL